MSWPSCHVSGLVSLLPISRVGDGSCNFMSYSPIIGQDSIQWETCHYPCQSCVTADDVTMAINIVNIIEQGSRRALQ